MVYLPPEIYSHIVSFIRPIHPHPNAVVINELNDITSHQNYPAIALGPTLKFLRDEPFYKRLLYGKRYNSYKEEKQSFMVLRSLSLNGDIRNYLPNTKNNYGYAEFYCRRKYFKRKY